MRRRVTARMPSRAHGFTVIEILIALAITAFGFAAIFSLQGATIQSNVGARDLAAGTNLAERYASRLRAMGSVATSNAWPAQLVAARGQWQTFAPDAVDHNGLTADETRVDLQRYCVHFWVDAPAGLPSERILNGRVRVVWPNANSGVEALDEVCDAGGAAAFEETPGRFYSVTLPVVIRRGGGM